MIQFPIKLTTIAYFCRPNDLTMPVCIFFMQSGKQLIAIMSGMLGKNHLDFGQFSSHSSTFKTSGS